MSSKASSIFWHPLSCASSVPYRQFLWGFFALICSATPPTHAAAQEASYVVMGPEGAVARAVFQNDVRCPAIEFDGVQQQMDLRAKPSHRFAVTVCEKLIPPQTKSASIFARALPAPKDTLASIVVLGDTGCRMKSGKSDDDEGGKFQACNDPSNKWPFSSVSSAAAKSRPDLVIHVGDYLYRESKCPKKDGGCKASPWGDDWPAWNADFFLPARDLLAAAPWIMARGNHEIRTRAGEGYFRLLDPALARGQVPPPCVKDLEPYSITTAGRQFIVLDSSGAPDGPPDKKPKQKDIDRYAEQFRKLQPTPHAWLISHRPVWGVKSDHRSLNETLYKALPVPADALLTNIDLVLSGHIHLWEAIGFTDRLSPQFVLGDGGTELADAITDKVAGSKIGARKVEFGRFEHFWGFTQFKPTLTPPAEGAWTATLFDATGSSRVKCTFMQGKVDCT